MADYPFLDPSKRYYVGQSRMVDCAVYIQKTAAEGIRRDNNHWRIDRSAGYGGTQDGHTVKWLVRNYPSTLPSVEWTSPGSVVRGAPTLVAVVELGFRGGYGAGQSKASMSFPPLYSREDGKPEATGSIYDVLLRTSMYYIHADGTRETIYGESVTLTTPLSVDSILTDVGGALVKADISFGSYLTLYGPG